jgi:hypothetical protein
MQNAKRWIGKQTPLWVLWVVRVGQSITPLIAETGMADDGAVTRIDVLRFVIRITLLPPAWFQGHGTVNAVRDPEA